MSVRYNKLSRHRNIFEALTGLSPERFHELAARLKPDLCLQQSPEANGRKPCLPPTDQLLLALIRFYRRPSYKLLAVLFETSEETVKRTLRLITPLLRRVDWEAPASSASVRKQYRLLSLLLEDIPGLAPLLLPGAVTRESDSGPPFIVPSPITELVVTSSGARPKCTVLQRLREAARLSQCQVAAHFNLRDRRSIGAWETGKSRPHVRHREQFRRYLLDALGLRPHPQLFLRIWQEIMVEEWTWPPLDESNLRDLFLGSVDQVQNSVSQIRLTLMAGQGHRAPFLAPPRLPCQLVGQDQLLVDLKQRLCEPRQAFLALYGSPGVGKTALAIAVSHDKRMLHRFSGGVLWAQLGSAPNSRASLTTWGGILGMAKAEMDRLATNESWAQAIQSRIGERRMLLVIDDARQVETALLFKVGGPHCAHLVTTRFPQVAVYFAGEGVIPVYQFNS
jgi:transcriptional regulator with XRE-family HTH domain